MAELKNLGGRPAIFIDGKFYPPMMATIRTNNIDHMCIDREYYRNLGKAGIKIFFVICDTVWLKPNAIELFKEEAEIILEEVPDAYIIPRMGLHPTNEWIKENPEECVTFSDGSQVPYKNFFTESYVTDIPALYSLCSKKWREDAGKALEETWKILMSLPYADRIVGCFLAAGGTSEWYYLTKMAFFEKGIAADHSLAFKQNFTKYLTEKYKSDENLKKHWKNPEATLENPPIPSCDKHYFAERVDFECNHPGRVLSNGDAPTPKGVGTSVGAIIDVDKNVDVFDFYRALHNGTADSVLHFAKIIKDMTPDKLVGAFYGSFGCTNFLCCGTSGGTVRILNSPYIDFLAAPGVYENRQIEKCEGQREMHDSFALHNKMFIVEQDTRTHMENDFFKNRFGIYDITDSINIMKREFGRNIADDTQAWWFDQLLGGKRYKANELYELISKQQVIAEESYSLDRTKNAEIALIFDEESAQLVSDQSTYDLIEIFRNYELPRIGAPVDQYFHNDISDPNMPDYKLYIFVNTLCITDAEREEIHKKLAKNNATAVWIWASGVVNEDKETKLSANNISALTGFDMEMDICQRSGKFRIEKGECVASLKPRYIYGYEDRVRDPNGRENNMSWMFPAFYPKDGEVCARFVTTGKPAVCYKDLGSFKSIFHGSKSINSDTIRSFASFAGCHIYSDSDDVFYIGKNYITVHSTYGKPITLKFPENVTLEEVYEKKIYGENVDEVTIDMYIGETKTFRLIGKDN